jgi:6-phosphogluconolactonase
MASPRVIEVCPTPAALMETGADRFIAAAGEAVRRAGRFAVALSGGQTPRSLYERLAAPEQAARVEWSRVLVFWSDERCVPPDHPESNYRMAREALLDKVPIPPENVHRIRGEDEPWRAADAYEEELRRVFGAGDRPPRLDLVLLGLGADGHTASLFPGGNAVRETRRWVVAERVPALASWRVTLTPVLIDEALEVIFLVSGREKAPALRRVLEGPRDPVAIPAQAIAPRSGSLRWLVDAAAASELGGAGGGTL